MNRMARQFTLLTALAVSAVTTACSTDAAAPAVPIAGTLLLSLATPAADDGAIVLTITGPGVSTVQAANSGYQVFWRLVSDRELRVIVIGALRSGPLLSLQASDVGSLARYSVTIDQVAAPDNTLRAAVTGYSAPLTRAGAQ